MRLPDFRHDRLLHFFYGAGVAFPLILLFGYIGLMVAVLISIAKEVWDALQPDNKFDGIDLMFGVLPAFMLWIIQVSGCFIC